ncbi:DUF4352 domain-containing protein [Tepidiforma sp.]|uniref:DUF4352 domain-containing protein n=1 Tax=Tepidiforma sp. TaxID=2682230 RepID=UPI002ADE3B09|nr:DUF4352 domain-containing protein [Tepidiforma sp.]
MSWLRALLIFFACLGIFALGVFTFAVREAERLEVASGQGVYPGSRLPPGDALASPTPAAGSDGVVGGIRYTVLERLDPEPAGSIPVSAGARRVALLLRLEAETAAVTYNFALLRLRGSDGVDYTWVRTAQEPPLRQGTLRPGESVTGWVAFELPRAVEPAALLLGSGTRAVIVLDVR